MIFLKSYKELVEAGDEMITEFHYNVLIEDERECMVCGRHVWRYGETGLCHTCSTGNADSEDDYEIGPEYNL
jgi:hypothetical protein